MLKNILMPEKVGSYYLFDKRVLSFEINHAHIQATLMVYKGRSVSIEKSEGLFLSDFSAQSVENGIKKLASSIGKYDEVVTSASSLQVVFKELEIPFIGQEKIGMIVGFEVEPLLPFSYQEAVIDFMVLNEDLENKKSKILVAAARKVDVNNLVQNFDNAKIQIDQVTIDLFAFYKVYQASLHKPGRKVSELFVNIGIDTSFVMYINKGAFQGSRVIPLGLSSIAQKISSSMDAGYHDVLQRLLHDSAPDSYNEIISSEIDSLAQQIQMSMRFFEKSSTDYQAPHQIFLYGVGSCLVDIDQAIQNKISAMVTKFDFNALLEAAVVKVNPQVSIDSCHGTGIISALSIGLDNDTNFLSHRQEGERSRLFLIQLAVLFAVTIGGLGLLYWSISDNISALQSSYTSSKRELSRAVEKSMNIKIPRSNSLATIVSMASENLRKEKELWFSFSQQSFLEYLQKLSNIDRKDLGLELTKVQLNYDSIILEGSVEDFPQLSVLQDEIGTMQIFTIEEKPTEPTFSMKLKINRQDES